MARKVKTATGTGLALVSPGSGQAGLPLESLCPASQLAHCRSPRCLSFQVVLSLLLCGAYPLYRCFRRCCMVSNNLLTQKNNRVHHYGSAANVPGTPTLGLYQCRALGAAAPSLLLDV